MLGGGGARGFAHLGVLRALAEAGVPIDWVGGTSIGAIIAALVAQGVSPDEALGRCREHFQALKDPTLPLVSLLAGRRIRGRLDDAFGTLAIEDLPLPYLCISTNLSRAAQAVHERGPVAPALRASISLPGILPPMRLGNDLHVDGGLVNNLPIDVMIAKPEIGAVIAVDVGAELEMAAPAGFEPEVSGWRVLWERFVPRPGAARPPTIMSVLTRSSFVASVYWTRERRTAEQASLYLRIPVADLRLLAFERIDAIASRGYEATREAIRNWWEARNSIDARPRCACGWPELVRTRQPEHVLGDVREHEVGGDRRDLIEARLAELALDVVLLREREAAVGLHAHVGGLPRRLGGELLRHVRLGAARLAVLVQLARALDHERRRADRHVGARDRELDALVLPDLPPEDLAFDGVVPRLAL